MSDTTATPADEAEATASADAATAKIPSEGTTIGALVEAVTGAISSVVRGLADLVNNIAHLDPRGDEQLSKLDEKASGDMKTYLSSIFADSADPSKDAVDLDIGNSHLTMNAKGSFTKSGGASNLFSPVEAYAFAKSAFANEALVKSGLHLQILEDGGATAKDPKKYKKTDLQNLAMCYVAAKSSGLKINNEAQVVKTLKAKADYISWAQGRWDSFITITEDPDNPHFEHAKKELDELTVEKITTAEAERKADAGPKTPRAETEAEGAADAGTGDAEVDPDAIHPATREELTSHAAGADASIPKKATATRRAEPVESRVKTPHGDTVVISVRVEDATPKAHI